MRTKKEIETIYDEIWEKVWWFRHKVLSAGKESTYPKEAFTKAKEIEDKYGIDSLTLSDYDWVIMEGKMSALAWVLGQGWDGSLDT